MDFSTISNKTEAEEVTNGELSERYYLLKKQHENLSCTFETLKQELHDTRRSYQTALDVQSHLTLELETHQAEEKKRHSDFSSKLSLLQEEISALREERAESSDRHEKEIARLQSEIRRLKEETANQVLRQSPERDPVELEETRNALAAALSEASLAKEALEVARTEIASWQLQGESLSTEIEQLREAAEIRREELRSLKDAEATALAELTEARAMLHQFTEPQDAQPHAAKGNSLFAEVEDKRQEMAKTLIQMKQTNSKLKRDLANKQAELETLLHEKQTIWEQQLGAAAHYDRELIESYEERISQLEALTERQRRELTSWFAKQCEPTANGWLAGVMDHMKVSYEERISQLEALTSWFAKQCEPTANGWLAGVMDHMKSELETLRAEVLSKGAAQLACAAQVRELRRKLAANTATGAKIVPKESPTNPPTKNVMRDITNNVKERMSMPSKVEEENLVPNPSKASNVKAAPKSTVDDVKKRVTFH